LVTGLALSLILAAGGAGATTTGYPIVYHSPGDTGLRPPHPPYLPKASSVTLHLWMDAGPVSPGSGLCDDGAGDASCAYDVRVNVQGDSKLVGFTGIGDVVYHPNNLSPSNPATTLRLNRLAKTTPIVGRQKIGTLVVDTSFPLGGLIEVNGVHSVGAAQQRDAIPTNTLAFVPEPDQMLLLVSGLAGLALLDRLRRRR
jgi:hypothetical protein